MAGFRRAKAEQAALKIGIYGAAGTGKTFNALMVGEGLAAIAGKRLAFVDTEHGTDFYCKPVPERTVHPEAFDFDALYAKSITEISTAVRSLNPDEHAVVVIDSITHLWEAARGAYNGKKTRAGTIPMYAWGEIKKPYKDLMSYLLSSPMHVIICGRQGNDYETDEETEELKCVGTKMKAEGETPYEPHILLKLDTKKDKKGNAIITAFAEKDRSSKLAGRTIQLWPSDKTPFQLLAAPILPLLGGTQAKIETDDEVNAKDAEALSDAEGKKIKASEGFLADFSAKIQLAKSPTALKSLGKEITPEIKKQMMPSDVSELRTRYQEAEQRLTGAPATEQEAA